jgi:hypothetical protein
MSYPSPRYFGETGDVSASFRRADHEPELIYPSGGTVHYLATGGSTAGQFGLYRWNFAPSSSGPDPKRHASVDVHEKRTSMIKSTPKCGFGRFGADLIIQAASVQSEGNTQSTSEAAIVLGASAPRFSASSSQ